MPSCAQWWWGREVQALDLARSAVVARHTGLSGLTRPVVHFRMCTDAPPLYREPTAPSKNMEPHNVREGNYERERAKTKSNPASHDNSRILQRARLLRKVVQSSVEQRGKRSSKLGVSDRLTNMQATSMSAAPCHTLDEQVRTQTGRQQSMSEAEHETVKPESQRLKWATE